MMNGNIIRGALFDAVGTLIYADPPVANVYAEAAEQHGVQVSLTEIEQRIASAIEQHFAERTQSSEVIERDRWRAIVAEVFHDAPKAVDAIFSDLWTHFASPSAWRLFDDVEACFAALRELGVRVGIASNFDARLKQVCAGHDVLSDVDVFCSSELGFAKPHVEFFRAIEQRLQLPPSSLTMVGDDLVLDHQAAVAAGWRSIPLVRDGRQFCGSIDSLHVIPQMLAR